jgi:hypothetical protein
MGNKPTSFIRRAVLNSAGAKSLDLQNKKGNRRSIALGGLQAKFVAAFIRTYKPPRLMPVFSP